MWFFPNFVHQPTQVQVTSPGCKWTKVVASLRRLPISETSLLPLSLSLSRIYIYIYINICTHIHIYIYIWGREGERERESYTYVICTVCLYHWLSLHISIYWVDLGFSYFKPCTPGPLPPPHPARVRVLHAASQHQRHGHGHGRPGRGRCDRFYGSFWEDFINKVMIL